MHAPNPPTHPREREQTCRSTVESSVAVRMALHDVLLPDKGVQLVQCQGLMNLTLLVVKSGAELSSKAAPSQVDASIAGPVIITVQDDELEISALAAVANSMEHNNARQADGRTSMTRK